MGAARSAERSDGVRRQELTGQDELAVDGTDSSAAIGLIGRLGGRASALQLTACDRDRVLARIYTTCYGERVESTLICEACSKPFDISFTLEELAERNSPNREALEEADGSYRGDDGVRFRLPTGEDELAIANLTAEEAVAELLRRCVLEAPSGFDAHVVQEAMERVAPILDVDISTSCPECGAATKVRFDLQSYLLQSLLQDRAQLWRDTHALASTYRWSLDEILSLRRSDRRMLVSLIESTSAPRVLR